MDEAAAKDSIKSLIENDLIEKDLNEYIYIFNKYDPDRMVYADLTFYYDFGILSKVSVSLGHLERYVSGTKFVSECITKEEVNFAYELYQLKYGEPEEVCDECMMFWDDLKNIDILFSKGYKNAYTCDTSLYVMGAAIYYEIPQSELDKLEKKEKERAEKDELNSI